MKSSGTNRLLGLITRRNCYVPTWKGWICLGLLFLGLVCGFILKIHPFLAQTHRVEAKYLVVEGWIGNYALAESIDEFNAGGYEKIFTVGGTPLSGINIEEGDNKADQAAKILKWMGMDEKNIQRVPCFATYRNRTFESALALRNWFETNQTDVAAFNVVTIGTHARRSRLLFERAFDKKVKIGIISIEDREYDPKTWWKTSEGVKEVISEGIGYVYARLFFSGTY